MIYTTRQFRVNSNTKIIEIYEYLEFVILYKKLVYLWAKYNDFCRVAFPSEILKTFPITKHNSIIKKGKVYSW